VERKDDKKGGEMSRLILIGLMVTFVYALQPVKSEPAKLIRGDEEINAPHYPSGPGLSPGDSVGWTKYDYQRNGQTAWQVWYDGASDPGIHVDFMRAHEAQPWPDRCCAYNFWQGGSWFGDADVTPGYSGYVALAVKPSNNAGVCAYHHQASGDLYRCWVSVDEGQGYYNFTYHKVLPQEQTEQIIWPRLAIDDQGNFHIVNHSYDYERIYYTRSTDDGQTWSDKELLYEESQANQYRNLAGGVFADRFNSPGKVIRYWPEWTGEGTGGHAQHSQDVCYQISTDYGVTWGSRVNLTQYQPSDTMRAFCHIKAIFDKNGDPHIVFPVCYFRNGTAYYRSWIIHWSPSTGFTVVTGPHSMSNPTGGWRLPCDFAQIAVDKDNGNLYLVYVLNRDSDMSAGGYPNGELMALASTDGGATWTSNAAGDTGVNLTKTPTPGGAPGECCDDDYPSMHPYTITFNGEKCVVISYVEDKDAGGLPQGEGTETDNPYRVLIVPCDSILIGVEEQNAGVPKSTGLIGIYPNPTRGQARIEFAMKKEALVKINVLDITGRVVDRLVNRVIGAGYHTAYFKSKVPAGIYFVHMETEGYSDTRNLILVR